MSEAPSVLRVFSVLVQVSVLGENFALDLLVVNSANSMPSDTGVFHLCHGTIYGACLFEENHCLYFFGIVYA